MTPLIFAWIIGIAVVGIPGLLWAYHTTVRIKEWINLPNTDEWVEVCLWGQPMSRFNRFMAGITNEKAKEIKARVDKCNAEMAELEALREKTFAQMMSDDLYRHPA